MAALLLASHAPAQEGGPGASERAAQAEPSAPPPRPAARPLDPFAEAVRELAQSAGQSARIERLAGSVAGRDVQLLRLAAPGPRDPDQRPAILVVGGIDADVPAASEIALGVVENLVKDSQAQSNGPAAELLRDITLYVIPRANPDGVEAYFSPVRAANRVNRRPLDNDRDGTTDEDGPNDLNGDGLITLMRVRDPQGEWMIDPAEPRLMKKADPNKGERGEFRLLEEGFDDDGDGQINEDSPGGVDLDRNWPHLFESGTAEAGIFPLSEPENRAIAEFVLTHPNICAAIVYGRHDNIVSPAKDAKRGPSGQDYRDLHPDDVKLYENWSEKYKALTGLKSAPDARPEGALYSWLYNQQGILTFAVSGWWPLDRDAPASGPSTAPAATDSQREADAAPAAPQGGTAPPPPPPGRGGGRRGGGRGGPPPGSPSADAGAGKSAPGDGLGASIESSDMNRKWLALADKSPGAFVAWTPIRHPTLGAAEVGGFAPFSRTTPSADELPVVAKAQAEFLMALGQAMPRLRFLPPRVKSLGNGLWQIDVQLVNEGRLPTHLAMTRLVRKPPISVRLSIEKDRIVGGALQERVESLSGAGGAAKRQWIVRGRPGEKLPIRAFSRSSGEILDEIQLVDTETQEFPR